MSKKILIIDDDSEILFSMAAICELAGWTPITSLNVRDGIIKFKEQKPDIILIDYHLPILNGIDGVKRLRSLDKEIPIIVLTVEEDQKIADKFLSVGANDFALKPIKAPDIISRIRVHLKLKESMESNQLKFEDNYIKGISNETLDIL